MADGVHLVADAGDGVGVAVAGLDPDEVAVPVGVEGALEVRLGEAHGVAGAVEAGVVDLDVADARDAPAVAHGGVDRGHEERAGGGVEERESVAGVGGAVGRLGGAAHDDLRAVRGGLEAVDLGVRADGVRGPVQEGAVDRGEGAAGVDRAAVDVDRVDRRGGHGSEARDEGPVPLRDVEGGETAVPGIVHLVEGAADVERRAVVAQRESAAGVVEDGGEVLDELTGAQVVGQDVRARGLVGAGLGSGGTGGGELADDVDDVADDELVPHDPVDLHGRQGLGGVPGLLTTRAVDDVGRRGRGRSGHHQRRGDERRGGQGGQAATAGASELHGVLQTGEFGGRSPGETPWRPTV